MIGVKCEVYEKKHVDFDVCFKLVDTVIFEKAKLDEMKKAYKERRLTLVVINDRVIL